jgi:hypothetical protein
LILFSEIASDGLKKFSPVFNLSGCVFPLIIFLVYQSILKKKHKKNPELYVKKDWMIQGILCPKCRTGKIYHSILYDGNEKLCGRFLNQMFFCLNCKTIYPEYCLTKYLGFSSPWMRGR